MNSEDQERLQHAEAASPRPVFGSDITARQVIHSSSELSDTRELKEKELGKAEISDEGWWGLFYKDADAANTPSEAKLKIESQLLQKAWIEFLTESQGKKGDPQTKQIALANENITSLDELNKIISAAKGSCKGSGRLRHHLDKLCRTLDSHSNLFDILPNQNQYCSIFCGAIKTLVKASTNNQKVFEALTRDLTEIGDAVRSCVDHVKLFSTTEMQDLVFHLYTIVFGFLREAFKWYEQPSWKRGIRSFNQNLYDEAFLDSLKEIRRVALLVQGKAGSAHHAETRDMKISLERSNEGIKETRDTVNKIWEWIEDRDKLYWQSQRPENPPRRLKALQQTSEIGGRINETSETWASSNVDYDLEWRSITKKNISEHMRLKQTETLFGIEDNGSFCDPPNVISSSQTYFKTDVQESSRVLGSYLIAAPNPISLISNSPYFADHIVVHMIQEWSTATASQMLWIMGTQEHRYPSSTSMIAASIIKSATNIGIPLVQIFCDWPGKNEEKVIVNILYSMIRQLVDILPPKVETRSDFSAARFGNFDGSFQTWDKALSICAELFLEVPSPLLVVIDGIEHVSLGSSREKVESLLGVLNAHISRVSEQDKSPKLFKVLFTTAGNCAALNKLGNKDLKIVKASVKSAKQSPGKFQPGMTELLLFNRER